MSRAFAKQIVANFYADSDAILDVPWNDDVFFLDVFIVTHGRNMIDTGLFIPMLEINSASTRRSSILKRDRPPPRLK